MLDPQPLQDRFKGQIEELRIDISMSARGGDSATYAYAKAASEVLGVSSKTVQRWQKKEQRIGLRTAERICERLGFHPFEIWGDEWINLILGPPESYRGGCSEI
jgi:hypothetical protein